MEIIQNIIGMTSRSEASYKKGQVFYVEVYNVLLFCEVKIKMYVTYNEWILVNQLFGYMFVEYSLLYFWFLGFQRFQKDFSPISIHFFGQNVPAWLQIRLLKYKVSPYAPS